MYITLSDLNFYESISDANFRTAGSQLHYTNQINYEIILFECHEL